MERIIQKIALILREVIRAATDRFVRRAMRFAMVAIVAAPLYCLSSACDSKPASPTASVAKASVNDKCAAHGLPDANCPFCHAELVREYGECSEHGVPEALCWICKPALVDVYKKMNDWCGGHDRPESLCFICNPEREAIVAAMLSAEGAPAASAHHDDDGHDHDHATDGAGSHDGNDRAVGDAALDAADLPRSARAPSVTCTTSSARVRLASADVARNAGFEFETVRRREISQTLECNGEIAYDANHYARVSSRVAGVVQSVAKDVGAMVQQGDVLAVVDSAELAFAKAEYLQANETLKLWEQNHDATHALVEKGIAGSQEDLAAENKLAEAKIQSSKASQQLRVLGLSLEQIEALAGSHDTSPLLALTAPFAGEIVERSAVMGETVDSTKPLFSVADTGTMWATLDVYEKDISLVRVGQPVIVQVDGLRGESFAGEIAWISRQIDPKTRTLHVRADLSNESGQLRANMFGRATITLRDREPLLAVPKSAVQWDGCCNVAFVKITDTAYQPRKLLLGADAGDYFAVRGGLSEGDTIVTQGSFMLKTEIMKSSIGAGCCEAGH